MAKVYSFQGLVPVIDPTAFVHPDAVLIGDVIIGAGVFVGPGAALRGDFGRLIIERGCNFQDNCIMHGTPGTDTVVEEDGHIGHGAVLHGCRVKRNALVGIKSVVLDGAVVGENAFVAAGAVVRAGFEVPAGMLAAGVPAKVVRPVAEDDLRWKREATALYQKLAQLSLATLRPAEPLSAPEPDRPRTNVTDIKPMHESRRR
ncbi:MAG TPA: phenylacetic acid degradation protein PaaY [Alphaproteobacteria bacterium]